jgi:DNA-binding NarL/FixJ family response regulator
VQPRPAKCWTHGAGAPQPEPIDRWDEAAEEAAAARPARTHVRLGSLNSILLHFLRDPVFNGSITDIATFDVTRTNAEQLTRMGREFALIFDEASFARGHEQLAEATIEGPLILLADMASRPLVRRFLVAGGSAVVPTSAPREVFTCALRLALAGEVYAPPALWFQGLLRAGPMAETEPGAPRISLTEREADVLAELSEGKNNKLIAHALGVAEPTVKMHLSSLARKLDASNRTQILTRALAMGLLTAG